MEKVCFSFVSLGLMGVFLTKLGDCSISVRSYLNLET